MSAATESDLIALIDADEPARSRRVEFFAADRLGDAIMRLYERHAELLPAGPDHERAAATARAVAAMVRPYDLERMSAVLAPTVERVDHRPLNLGSARGRDAFLQWLRAFAELAESVVLRFDDILALQPDALLVRRTTLGTDRSSGGTFESEYLHFVRVGSDGLLTHTEWFDADSVAEALARFDELTPEGRPIDPFASPLGKESVDKREADPSTSSG